MLANRFHIPPGNPYRPQDHPAPPSVPPVPLPGRWCASTLYLPEPIYPLARALGIVILDPAGQIVPEPQAG